MHHRPSGPPVSARLRSFVTRIAWYLRPWAGTRTRRLGVLLAATAAVTAVLLATPVVTAPQWPSVAVGSSSSQTPTTAPPVESSTAWPAPRTSPSASSPAPVAEEEPVADPTGPSAPATSEQATTAPSTTEAIPADESTPAPAAGASDPAPSPSTTAAGSAAAPASPAAPVSPAAPAAPATAATPEVLGTEAQVLALVNQHRADAGCAPLAADEGLAGVARAHSADMRDQDFFAHVNLAGADPFTRAEKAGVTARAENIAQGQQDAGAVVDAWMNSAGHRANILDCSLERLGVGVATGAGGPWWTQLFG